MVKAIIAMLRTTLPGSDDDSFRRVFKALLPSEKEVKKKVVLPVYFASRMGTMAVQWLFYLKLL